MTAAPDPRPNVVPAPPGLVEPHLALLAVPPDGQLVYKVMRVEHLIDSIANRYLHFTRVDSYPDLPGYDPHDGAQLRADRDINAAVLFKGDPAFNAATYYDRCRARTYACCFSLKIHDYIWNAYGNGSTHGKVGVVFDFQKLRHRLNGLWTDGQARMLVGDEPAKTFLSINYGVVDYVDLDQHRANQAHLANPIQYAYLKARRFEDEHELRVTLSAIGMGHYAVGGVLFDFPPTVQVHFDFHAAFMDFSIRELIAGPGCDRQYLEAELARLGADPVATPPAVPGTTGASAR